MVKCLISKVIYAVLLQVVKVPYKDDIREVKHVDTYFLVMCHICSGIGEDLLVK